MKSFLANLKLKTNQMSIEVGEAAGIERAQY
jgi:hypothetical protein